MKCENVFLDISPAAVAADQKDRQVPAQIQFRGDGSLSLWVGSPLVAGPVLSSLIIAYPGTEPSATVLLANSSSLSMEAALSASKRMASRYKRPVRLAFPPTLASHNEGEAFMHLEVALRKRLDELIGGLAR